MKAGAWAVVGVMVVCGAGRVARAEEPGTAPIREAEPVAIEIPIDIVHHHVLVPVRIDGSRPFHLVLDTGMPIPGALLNPSPRTEKLKLENPEGRRMILGGESQEEPRLGTGVELDLGGVKLSDQIVAVVELPCRRPGESPWPGEVPSEGVIGISVFDRYVVTIDYAAKKLILEEPESFEYRGEGREVALSYGPSGIPEVEATVELTSGQPVPVTLVVDTGATYGLSLTLGDHPDLVLPDDARELVSGRSLWGPVSGRLARTSAFRLGPFELSDMLTTFFRKGEPGVPQCSGDGIVGNEMLERFRVTFDYARDRMFLEPGPRLNEPFEFEMLGARWTRNEAGNLHVDAVLPDTPALRAGLKEHDEVTAIDGRATREMTREEVDERLRADGASLELSVAREGRSLELTVTLKRLV